MHVYLHTPARHKLPPPSPRQEQVLSNITVRPHPCFSSASALESFTQSLEEIHRSYESPKLAAPKLSGFVLPHLGVYLKKNSYTKIPVLFMKRLKLNNYLHPDKLVKCSKKSQ